MAKNKIRITESELKQIINESVKNVLNEIAKYAQQQGIWSYSTPKREYIKATYNREIQDTIQRMLLDADTLENT